MSTETLLVILLQILSMVFIVYGIFFKSYFKKKGENVATKEDISEITEKIESVKHTFDVNLEKNRAIFQKDLQKDALFLNERTARLLNLYDSVITFRLENIGFNPWNEMSKNWEETFKNHHECTFKAFRIVNKNYALCSVFLYNHPSLLDSVHNLMLDTSRVFEAYKNHFFAVKVTFVKEQAAFGSGDKSLMDEAVEKANNAFNHYSEKLDITKFTKFQDDFIIELSKFFGEIDDSNTNVTTRN